MKQLLEEVLYALEYASDMTKPDGLSGCDCPICTMIPKVKEELAKPEPEKAYVCTGCATVECLHLCQLEK